MLFSMSREQIAFAIAMALVPLALFLVMASLALIRVFIARISPRSPLLVRIDRGRYGERCPGELGSGGGDLWAELTHEFRALYQ